MADQAFGTLLKLFYGVSLFPNTLHLISAHTIGCSDPWEGGRGQARPTGGPAPWVRPTGGAGPLVGRASPRPPSPWVLTIDLVCK